MSTWSDAWTAAAELAARVSGIGASITREVSIERIETMRAMFRFLRKADPEAFSEAICDHARHAADAIAQIVGLQAEVEVERASRQVREDDPTHPFHIIVPPEAKGPSK